MIQLSWRFLWLQNFVTDFSSVIAEGAFDGDKSILVNEVISEHFMRQGMLDIADSLIEVFLTHIRL